MVMEPQTLQWFTFETAPIGRAATWWGEVFIEVQPDTDNLNLTPAGEALPEAVSARLLRLCDEEFDSGHCEVNGCGGYGQDGERMPVHSVGYGLAGEADEITTWAWTTIVLLPDGRTVLACEDCCPDTLYLMAVSTDG